MCVCVTQRAAECVCLNKWREEKLFLQGYLYFLLISLRTTQQYTPHSSLSSPVLLSCSLEDAAKGCAVFLLLYYSYFSSVASLFSILSQHPPSHCVWLFFWVCLPLPCVFFLSTHTENDPSLTGQEKASNTTLHLTCRQSVSGADRIECTRYNDRFF